MHPVKGERGGEGELSFDLITENLAGSLGDGGVWLVAGDRMF
jgi:hypothetical protein